MPPLFWGVFQVSLVLSLLIPIVVSVNHFYGSYSESRKQAGFTLNRHVVHAPRDRTARKLAQHSETQATQRPLTKEQNEDKLTRNRKLSDSAGSYDRNLHENITPSGDRPSMRSQINIKNPEIFPSYVIENSKNFRQTRDTSALGKSSASGVRQQAAYNSSHLSSMCPFADICDIKGREVQERNMDSCCLPCSCSSTCSLIGNCCDKRENIGNMCHYLFVYSRDLEDNVELGFKYFIIDTCLDGSDSDCMEMEAAPWGSLYPVYDPSSHMNFYNPQCAKCNGVQEFTKWGITLDCAGFVENEYIRRTLRGENTKVCRLVFNPPKTMNIQKNVCPDSKLIDSCNITGTWKQYDANLEEACLRWHAPVLGRKGYLVFENKYCELCNGVDSETEELCFPIKSGRHTLQFTHTFTIDYRQISAAVDQDDDDGLKIVETVGCDKGMVKHVSKPECRRVLCPNGFVGRDGNCLPLLEKLINDRFYVQLQLIPCPDTFLPRSYLRELNDDQQDEPGTWLDTKGALLDIFSVYSKTLSINNTEYVKTLVLTVGKKRYPLNLNRVIKTIQTAISKPWTISFKEMKFQFDVKFYKYVEFVPTQYGVPKAHVLNHLVLSGSNLTFGDNSPEDYFKDDMPFAADGHALFLKKTHFCNRLRLTRSEWIAGFREIRLNTSQEVFDIMKLLGDSEFDIFLDELGQPTVEICAEDFNPDYQGRQPSRRSRSTAASLGSSGILITTVICLVTVAQLADYSQYGVAQ